MIKIVNEINIGDFEAWSGAIDTLNNIEDHGKIDELQDLILAISETWEETELNDFLWFEDDYIYVCLEIE